MMRKSRTMAMGGVFTALSILALFAVSYIPNSKIFFYAISSLFVSFVVVEAGIGAGWIFYAASSLLSLLLVPSKLVVIPYMAFFGVYGLVKYYLEALKKPVLEYLLKGIYFIICEAGLYLLYTRVLSVNIPFKDHLYYIPVLLFVLFYVYDYLYTRFLSFYIFRFRKTRS